MEDMNILENIKQHGRLLVPDDNPGFDPERNKRMIAKVAKNNWNNRQKKLRAHKDKLDERIDATVSFLASDKFKDNRVTDSVLRRYFGKNTYGHLRGDPEFIK